MVCEERGQHWHQRMITSRPPTRRQFLLTILKELEGSPFILISLLGKEFAMLSVAHAPDSENHLNMENVKPVIIVDHPTKAQ
jgi:hypothetical protein